MSKSALRVIQLTILSLGMSTLNEQDSKRANQMQDFEIAGVGLFECQCPAYACPCQRNGKPTHRTCHASDFAHIESGHYGSVRLDGLNVAMVGNLVDANSDRLFATLYVDERATPEQRDAIGRIVEYMNGAYVALPDQRPVPFKDMKPVPINFRESHDRTDYELEIPSILKERALLKRNKAGQPLFSITAMDMWSNVVHNADNVEFAYHDSAEGKTWDYSGHYANVKYFTLTKEMYADKKMLGQHGDMSGTWTKIQLEIIRQAGLREK